MKRVEAFVQAFQLQGVADALKSHDVTDLVVSEVLRSDEIRVRFYRGAEYAAHYAPAIKLEVVVADEVAMPAVDAIVAALRTAGARDAQITVAPVDGVVGIGCEPDAAPASSTQVWRSRRRTRNSADHQHAAADERWRDAV